MVKTKAIQVFCRLKPLVIKNGKLVEYEIKNEKKPDILCFMHKKKEEFRFEKVFDENTTQSSIFKHVAVPILDKFLSGVNGTIFTYGQTGSGKTHTMYGTQLDKGIIPRSFEYIFENSSIKYTEGLEISISYIEIYNDIVYDLLPSKNTRDKNAELKKIVNFTVNKKGKVEFKNLNVFKIKNMAEALQLLRHGNAKRKVSSTCMNIMSSRSHCICRITYAITNNLSKLNTIVLNLVDLAGSECISKSINDKKTLSESRYINVSLFHLHQVMNSLRNPIHHAHVPYRNSSITRLLKGSLGFKCATAMITTVVLSQQNIVESISTCKYAGHVSGVKHIISMEPIRKQVKVKSPEKNKVSGNEYQCESNLQINLSKMCISMLADLMGLRVMESEDGISHILKMAKDDLIDGNVERVTCDDEHVQDCLTTYMDKSIQVRIDDESSDSEMTKVNGYNEQLKLNNVVVGAPVAVMEPGLMESGDGNCDSQKIININCSDSLLELNNHVNCVPMADLMDTRLMEPGDGSGDNQKITNVKLIDDNLVHTVGDNKHGKDCETQTVVVSSNASTVGVMTDMKSDDITNNSRRCRFEVRSVYRNCVLLFLIIAVIYIKMLKNELELNAVRLHSVIENLLKCEKSGLCTTTIAPDWLPTRQNPVDPSTGYGNRRCHCYNCIHHSDLYSKTIDDGDANDFETVNQDSKQKFSKWNTQYIIYIVVVILIIAMLHYKRFYLTRITDLDPENANNDKTITQMSTSLKTVSSTPENTALLQLLAHQVTISQCTDEKPGNHCVLKVDDNGENILHVPTRQVTVNEIPTKYSRRTTKFISVGYGIWRRCFIHTPTSIRTESSTEAIVPVQLSSNHETVSQCSEEKLPDCCISTVNQ